MVTPLTVTLPLVETDVMAPELVPARIPALRFPEPMTVPEIVRFETVAPELIVLKSPIFALELLTYMFEMVWLFPL